jgi:ABC-type glycerol-3-phosphate transport system substrate-binding protein
MKKLLHILVAVVFVILLTACGMDENADANGGANDAPATPSPVANSGLNGNAGTDSAAPGLAVPDISSVAAVSELEARGTLHIALYHDDPAFRKALSIFNENFPGWEVEIIPFLEIIEETDAEGNVISVEQKEIEDVWGTTVIKKADLINTYWGNTGTFADSGLLEDLSLMFQDDMTYNMNRMLPALRNLLLTGDGKLPVLPISFKAGVLFPANEIVIHKSDEIPRSWTWYEALDWFAEDFRTNGTELFLYLSAYNFMENNMLLDYVSSYYNSVTKRANFDSIELAEITRLTKYLLDYERIVGVHWAGVMGGDAEWDPENAKYLMNEQWLGENVVDYNTLMTGFGQAYPYPYLDGTEGKAVELYSAYGINAASSVSVKRAAWEFLKILISDEIQNGGLLQFGTSAVVSELTKEGVARNMYGNMMRGASAEEARRVIDSVTDEQVRAFNEARLAYFDDIMNLSYRPEGELSWKIFQGVTNYFEDKATLDECISRLRASQPLSWEEAVKQRDETLEKLRGEGN